MRRRNSEGQYEVEVDGKLHYASDKAGVRRIVAPFRLRPAQHDINIVWRRPDGTGIPPQWADFWWDL